MKYIDITCYKYQLSEYMIFNTGIKGYSFDTEFFKMYPDGLLLIRSGFMWNGASGPTYDSDDSMHGSLVHDVIYRAIRMGLLPMSVRILADKLLHDICTIQGMIPIRADAWYDAVRVFAEESALPAGPEPEYNIKEVPDAQDYHLPIIVPVRS